VRLASINSSQYLIIGIEEDAAIETVEEQLQERQAVTIFGELFWVSLINILVI
jgi:hypothetical protein